MENIFEILKIVLPAVVAIYGIYLVVQSFLNKYFENSLANIKLKTHDTTLPLRLQAYERMAIFLERITPNNLIVRTNDLSYNVIEFQTILNAEVRSEYNHNLSQQIYMSNEAWNMIKIAYEECIALINRSAEGLSAEAPSVELAKAIFNNLMEAQTDFTAAALAFLKEEVRTLYK
jgi:hypothetical protein